MEFSAIVLLFRRIIPFPKKEINNYEVDYYNR